MKNKLIFLTGCTLCGCGTEPFTCTLICDNKIITSEISEDYGQCYQDRNVGGYPSFFINGKYYVGFQYCDLKIE